MLFSSWLLSLDTRFADSISGIKLMHRVSVTHTRNVDNEERWSGSIGDVVLELVVDSGFQTRDSLFLCPGLRSCARGKACIEAQHAIARSIF